jgi:hypothetical protein
MLYPSIQERNAQPFGWALRNVLAWKLSPIVWSCAQDGGRASAYPVVCQAAGRAG